MKTPIVPVTVKPKMCPARKVAMNLVRKAAKAALTNSSRLCTSSPSAKKPKEDFSFHFTKDIVDREFVSVAFNDG